ncbi:hypothetical protein JKP88DRAFT_284033 [Tribonema minus]|uniref:Uncharacterized protein n=1 Tax=Tribonema minus TaxID=303371 RepID=A0A836C6X9_9STRA|nr:hypothetical protein JKP88DRAFT_284033 [Tribonema minus]
MVVPLDSTPGDPTAVTLSPDDVGMLAIFYRRRRTRRAVDVDSERADAGMLAAVHESVRAVLWAQRLSSRGRVGHWPHFGPPWPDSEPDEWTDANSRERCAALSRLLLALRPELSCFQVRTRGALALSGGAELVCLDHFHLQCTGGRGAAAIPRGLRAANATFEFTHRGRRRPEIDYAGLADGLRNAPASEHAGVASVWVLRRVALPARGDTRILEAIAAAMAARRARRSDGDWPPAGVAVELASIAPVRDPVGYGVSLGMVRVPTGTHGFWLFRTPEGGEAIELHVTRWQNGRWNVEFSSAGAASNCDSENESVSSLSSLSSLSGGNESDDEDG